MASMRGLEFARAHIHLRKAVARWDVAHAAVRVRQKQTPSGLPGEVRDLAAAGMLVHEHEQVLFGPRSTASTAE